MGEHRLTVDAGWQKPWMSALDPDLLHRYWKKCGDGVVSIWRRELNVYHIVIRTPMGLMVLQDDEPHDPLLKHPDDPGVRGINPLAGIGVEEPTIHGMSLDPRTPIRTPHFPQGPASGGLILP